MSNVIFVREQIEDPSGELNREGKLELQQKFHVHGDGPLTEYQVIGATGLPSPFASEHPRWPGAFCNRLVVKPFSDGLNDWWATAYYVAGETSGENVPQDPLQQPVRVSFGGDMTSYQKGVMFAYATQGGFDDCKDDKRTASIKDVLGTPTQLIHNTLGDPFDPLQVDDSYTGITIERNEPWSPSLPGLLIPLKKSVNNAQISVAGYAFPPRTLRLKDVKLDKDWYFKREGMAPCYYWKVAYQLEFNPDTFDFRLLNQGYYYLPRAGAARSELIQFTDGAGQGGVTQNSNTAKPLKKDGTKAVCWDPTTQKQVDQPVYLRFRVYREMDWSVLKLPSSP